MEINIFSLVSPLLCFPCHIFYHVIFIACVIGLLGSGIKYIFYRSGVSYAKKKQLNHTYFSYIMIAQMIYDFIVDNIHICNKQIFSFIMSFSTMLLFYNCAGVFPHVEELTKDINVCIAFALYGFLYVHYIALCQLGLNEYSHHWTKRIVNEKKFDSALVSAVFKIAAIIVNFTISVLAFPLKILEIGSLLFSLTFRLFGNMFGGSIVVGLVGKMQSAGILYQFAISITGVQLLVMLYFSFFEGLIQSFIFTLILLNTLGGFFSDD